jgi:hypothetical protein
MGQKKASARRKKAASSSKKASPGKKKAPTVKKKAANAGKKKPASSGKRVNWLDDRSQTPLIDERARNLASFLDALADGKVEAKELKAQDARVVALMKQVEPLLNDKLHAKVTELMCELTARTLMHVFYEMEKARPRTAFRG